MRSRISEERAECVIALTISCFLTCSDFCSAVPAPVGSTATLLSLLLNNDGVKDGFLLDVSLKAASPL